MLRNASAIAISVVARIVRSVAALLLAAIAVLIFARIIGRYLELYQLRWFDEVIRAMFLWAVFLASAVAVAENAHFRIRTIIGYLPDRHRWITELMAHLSLFVLGLVFARAGWQLVELEADQFTATLRIPYSLVYLPIFIAGVLFALFSLRNLLIEFSRSRRDVRAGVGSSPSAPEGRDSSSDAISGTDSRTGPV